MIRRAVASQGVVKRFFNEKEVTSTLVMDALFSGCKQLEEASRQPPQQEGGGGGRKVRGRRGFCLLFSCFGGGMSLSAHGP